MDELAAQQFVDEFRACLQTGRYSGIAPVTQVVTSIREKFQCRIRAIRFANPDSAKLCEKVDRVIVSMANREIQDALASRPRSHSTLGRAAYKSIARQRDGLARRTK
jgi:hypothetical protein